MAKSIYTLVDTDYVRDYLINNTELIDDDNSMTDEQLDQTIDRIVSASTDGRLFVMLGECFAHSRKFDKLLDLVDSCMYDFVAECLKEMEE